MVGNPGHTGCGALGACIALDNVSDRAIFSNLVRRIDDVGHRDISRDAAIFPEFALWFSKARDVSRGTEHQ
jgi:hypothetical protein